VAAERPLRLSPTARTVTVGVVAGAAVLFLLVVRGVLTPFVWAIVVAYALSPLVDWLVVRTGARRIVCVALPYLLGWGLLVWALTSYIPILNAETQQLATNISVLLPELYQRYANNMQQLTLFGVTINVQQQVADAAAGFAEATRTLGRQSVSFAGSVLDTITQLFTFNIALFYLLLDGRRLGPFVEQRLPPPYHAELVTLGRRVDTVLGRYLRAQLLLISIMACASFVALTILDVRFSVLLALVAGFMEIFPIIGPTAAITLVSVVAFVQHDNRFGLPQVSFVIIVALIFFIMRQLEDYLVIPNIVGHVVQLHPVVILFALFCGASVAGVLGMFLAVPLTGALKILLGYLHDKVVET
jgi:predicted PurR-regulated permease PerM